MPTAAILLIGNEILSGKVEDQNARFLISELRALGVGLRRIVVVPDVIDDIVPHLRELSAHFDHVFTSGGVGPTHDDLTMEAVARAFDRKVVRHPDLEALLRRYYGERLHDRALRMADVPEGADLVRADEILHWPVIAVKNVYILPGVPEIFRKKFLAIRARFRAEPFFVRSIYLRPDESQIAAALDRAQEAFPAVEIGSYPRFDTPDYRVKVTVESKDSAAVESCLAALLEAFPKDAVLRVE